MEPIDFKKPTFVIATEEWSGLGWAKLCADAGFPVVLACKKKEGDDNENYEAVGQGIISIMELEQALKDSNLKTAYWVWDQNHNPDIAEGLRAKGYKVFGGHALTDKMEHDRNFGTSLVQKAGLQVPETQEFDSVAEAVAFMEENQDRAFVFKPDDPDDEAWVTTVPDNELDDKANEEIRQFLESMPEGKGTFILQERKKGVEINIEVWLYEGKPFFAHANFECKRKYNHDLGRLIGCAQDVEFVIRLDSKILEDTLLKLLDLPEFKSFTGMVDMNLIVADREYYFLEFCGRFGYNSHPNLFLNLGIDPFPVIMMDFMEGRTADFYNHFRTGFGASILMTIDDPVKGLPFLIPEHIEKCFYFYDVYSEGFGSFCLAGYAGEVGVVCGHDYDLKSAADKALDNFYKIHYPGRAGRTDINLVDYLTNPYERWVACEAMRLFDKI